MPDPHRQTVSASQSAALFNASPYLTRWMLWQHHARGPPLGAAEDSRMKWGRILEPAIVEQASRDLRLECRPNVGGEYVRAGRLGCTRDAMIVCPDRGPGALECKCCFDYATWMRDWEGGRAVPPHIEIQLQTQMLVGSGAGPGWNWGTIAVWVCGGEIKYFERKPIVELWTKLEIEAAAFFASLIADEEPNPFGAAIELPWLNDLFPTTRGETLDLSND